MKNTFQAATFYNHLFYLPPKSIMTFCHRRSQIQIFFFISFFRGDDMPTDSQYNAGYICNVFTNDRFGKKRERCWLFWGCDFAQVNIQGQWFEYHANQTSSSNRRGLVPSHPSHLRVHVLNHFCVRGNYLKFIFVIVSIVYKATPNNLVFFSFVILTSASTFVLLTEQMGNWVRNGLKNMEVVPLVKHCAKTTALLHLSYLPHGLNWYTKKQSMQAFWLWSNSQCRSLRRSSGDRQIMKKRVYFYEDVSILPWLSITTTTHITCIKMYRLWNLLLNVWKIMKIIHKSWKKYKSGLSLNCVKILKKG